MWVTVGNYPVSHIQPYILLVQDLRYEGGGILHWHLNNHFMKIISLLEQQQTLLGVKYVFKF